jgi:hypothetical protein
MSVEGLTQPERLVDLLSKFPAPNQIQQRAGIEDIRSGSTP